MSTDKKVKVYKNPARNTPENVKQYVPQYQLMGADPVEYKSPLAPGYHIPMAKTPSADNPRQPRAAIRQPYAEAVPSPVGRGPLPNVGNNMEQTWSGVDGEITDDTTGLDLTRPMVDNNEMVSAEALRISPTLEQELSSLQFETETEEEVVVVDPLPQSSFLTKNELESALSSDNLVKIIKDLEEHDHLLMVSGEVICSGPEEYVQEQTRALVFGEHELYNGNPVSVDDIVVIKRTKIKIGVFLE